MVSKGGKSSRLGGSEKYSLKLVGPQNLESLANLEEGARNPAIA